MSGLGPEGDRLLAVEENPSADIPAPQEGLFCRKSPLRKSDFCERYLRQNSLRLFNVTNFAAKLRRFATTGTIAIRLGESLFKEHPIEAVFCAPRHFDVAKPRVNRKVLGHFLIRIEMHGAKSAPSRLALAEAD